MSLLDKLAAGHYHHPKGFVGRLAGWKMAQQHAVENAWTVALLAPRPDDLILEIGFGPGIAIEALAGVVSRGRVVGIDISQTMLAVARKRNAQAVCEGRVELKCGEASHLPFPRDYFDTAFGIHTLYFWPQPLDALREVHRVLKPSGKLVLTILPKAEWRTPGGQPDPGTPTCIPYSGSDVCALMLSAGFCEASVRADSDPTHASNFSVIGVK
jgi:SAM-dependent methyltransferase